ncbi:MAG: hypothetical protein ABH827_01820 [bacterium]
MKKLSVLLKKILLNTSLLICLASNVHSRTEKPRPQLPAPKPSFVNPVRTNPDITIIDLNSQPKTSKKNLNRAKTINARYDNKLCLAEKQIRAARLERAHETLQNFVQQKFPNQETPIIGIACSGGGCRAAVAALGLLQGLEDIKLLDSAAYLATLSGSTWLAASWMLKETSLQDLEIFLRKRLYKAFDPNKLKIEEILDSIWDKFSSGRQISLNDIWGGILGNVFLKTPDDVSGQHSYLSDLAPTVASGEYPIPVFTSAIANESIPYPWMEYTPFEVGSTYLETWIPTSGFGKEFKNGHSTDARSEETLAYMLGLFGSAYAASVYDAIYYIHAEIAKSFGIDLPDELFTWVTGFWFGNQRIATPKVPNFTYKVNKRPMYKDKYLTLPDAGVAINLPIPALFRRNIDIFIVCDATGGLTPEHTAMQLIQNYADTHHIEFPDFNSNDLLKTSFSVIIDKNNEYAPIIIYVRNLTEISTLDFNYSEKEFTSVLSNVKNSVTNNITGIQEAIKYALQLKATGYRKKKISPKITQLEQQTNTEIAQEKIAQA